MFFRFLLLLSSAGSGLATGLISSLMSPTDCPYVHSFVCRNEWADWAHLTEIPLKTNVSKNGYDHLLTRTEVEKVRTFTKIPQPPLMNLMCLYSVAHNIRNVQTEFMAKCGTSHLVVVFVYILCIPVSLEFYHLGISESLWFPTCFFQFTFGLLPTWKSNKHTRL
jgi:hypothetical protein